MGWGRAWRGGRRWGVGGRGTHVGRLAASSWPVGGRRWSAGRVHRCCAPRVSLSAKPSRGCVALGHSGLLEVGFWNNSSYDASAQLNHLITQSWLLRLGRHGIIRLSRPLIYSTVCALTAKCLCVLWTVVLWNPNAGMCVMNKQHWKRVISGFPICGPRTCDPWDTRTTEVALL